MTNGNKGKMFIGHKKKWGGRNDRERIIKDRRMLENHETFIKI